MEDSSKSVPVLLSVPESIGVPLIRAAKRKKVTVQAVILEVMAAHFGVEAEAPKRGRPWPKKPSGS